MASLPTWLAVLLVLASPFVAVIAIGATYLRELSRQTHERAMRLRDDRMQAYSTLVRLTKMVEASEAYQHTDIFEALAEIELLTDKAPNS